MKRIKYVAIILFVLLIITGCTNYNKIIEEQNNKASETIKDLNNIKKEKIKESYNYIVDNIDNIKDIEVYTKIVYNNEYLKLILDSNKENVLYDFTNRVNDYVLKSNSKNKKKLQNTIDGINNNLDEAIEIAYNNYYHEIVVNNIIKRQESQAIADTNDKNMKNTKQVEKALNYINIHIDNPYENEEILENIIYYSLYLKNLFEDQNDITKIGTNTINYLKELSSNTKQEIKRSITKIDLEDYKNILK